MVTKEHHWFIVCLFIATVDWYFSTIVVLCLAQFHITVTSPQSIYNMYTGVFFDEFQQHLFYMLFILLSLLFGFIIKLMPPIPSTKIKNLLLGTTVAILLIPLAAVGAYGVALTADWPAVAPPMQITAGFLLCIPGCVTLMLTFYQTIKQKNQISI